MKILNTLLSEIEIAQGQVAFAFPEQIDLTRLDDVGIKAAEMEREPVHSVILLCTSDL